MDYEKLEKGLREGTIDHVCIRLERKMKKENEGYKEELRQMAERIDRQTKFDTNPELIERHFIKTKFIPWAETKGEKICKGCDAKGYCGIKY